MKKSIAVLGATGSVGTQALEVALWRGYEVDVLSAASRVIPMEALCRRHHPRFAVMADESAAKDLAARLADTPVRVLIGESGMREAIMQTRADTVINAVSGASGLFPTLAVIESGRRLALANKESLVIAGSLVMQRARAAKVEILPVDSEHCAIFQCLKAGRKKEVKRLILTASGGAFYGYDRERLRGVTPAQTLAHPTWKMGKKITVDSATLMNKGFEILEAAHLFGISPRQVVVLIHRESIIHSAVEYIDNAWIAQMSMPDMRLCVQYAVDYPRRMSGTVAPLDLTTLGKLTFDTPDEETFPLLALAREAGSLGGGMGAVLNAADEVAVDAFLREQIPFFRIADVVGDVFDRLRTCAAYTTLEEFSDADVQTRALTRARLQALRC